MHIEFGLKTVRRTLSARAVWRLRGHICKWVSTLLLFWILCPVSLLYCHSLHSLNAPVILVRAEDTPDGQDHMKAYRLFTRGCEQGQDARACFGAGFMCFSGYGSHKRDLAAALRLWEHSCESGFGHACHWFARTHTLGLAAAAARAAGQPFDAERAENEHAPPPPTAFEGELIAGQLVDLIKDESPSVLLFTVFLNYNCSSILESAYE